MENNFNSTKDQVLAQLLFEQAHLEYVNSLVDEQSKAVKRINKLKQSMIDDQFKVSGQIVIDFDNIPLETRSELFGILNQFVSSTPGITYYSTKKDNTKSTNLVKLINDVTSRKENVTKP